MGQTDITEVAIQDDLLDVEESAQTGSAQWRLGCGILEVRRVESPPPPAAVKGRIVPEISGGAFSECSGSRPFRRLRRESSPVGGYLTT